jgi:hypothetical protein
MADEILRRDENSAVVLGGVTNDANAFIRMLRVDPVTNNLLVHSTGGGGGGSGYQLPTSGSVNGVNKTFTFSTAPNAINVDGVVYFKNTQNVSNTPIWTGTTTITFVTLTPNQFCGAVA